MAERNANDAEPAAMIIAKVVTRRRPARFTRVKATTKPDARALTGIPGRYHWCNAEAESSAVRPHVGTQPHQ